MTLGNLNVHLPIASRYKCGFLYTVAQYLKRVQLTKRRAVSRRQLILCSDYSRSRRETSLRHSWIIYYFGRRKLQMTLNSCDRERSEGTANIHRSVTTSVKLLDSSHCCYDSCGRWCSSPILISRRQLNPL